MISPGCFKISVGHHPRALPQNANLSYFKGYGPIVLLAVITSTSAVASKRTPFSWLQLTVFYSWLCKPPRPGNGLLKKLCFWRSQSQLCRSKRKSDLAEAATRRRRKDKVWAQHHTTLRSSIQYPSCSKRPHSRVLSGKRKAGKLVTSV